MVLEGTTLNTGTVVKLAFPRSTSFEDGQTFVVIEDRGPRVLLQGHIEGWRWQPTFVERKTDLEIVTS